MQDHPPGSSGGAVRRFTNHSPHGRLQHALRVGAVGDVAGRLLVRDGEAIRRVLPVHHLL